MRILATVVILLLTISSAHVGSEELLGDAASGRRLADDVCANCHMVAPGQDPATDAGAPAFPDIANQPGMTALSLRVFLQTPHERMPDLRLSRDETDDIIAYILSLEE